MVQVLGQGATTAERARVAADLLVGILARTTGLERALREGAAGDPVLAELTLRKRGLRLVPGGGVVLTIGVVPPAADDPRRHLERNGLLAGLVGSGGGGRRAFVDATGASVTPPPVIRRLVVTDDVVGALLLCLGAPVVGCAGALKDIAVVGAPRDPDLHAVAALRPDVIVTGAVERLHDLVNMKVVAALRQVAPVVAVDVGGRAATDLRALLGSVVGGGRPAAEPVSDRRVGAPTYRTPT